MYKISMVSLGCPKNQVDAEMMLATIKKAGYEIGAPEAEADAIIINTCGFIEEAKAEAIEKDANTKADKIVAEAEQEYDKLKEKGYRILSEKVAQEVDSYWVNTEEMDIYFGGGTTQRMKIYNGTLVEAPQMATAKGLYIVGTKVFK